MNAPSALEQIFTGTTGKIEIRPLPPSPEYPPRFFITPPEAAAYARALDGKVQLYVGAGTRLRESGGKDDVQELPGLWADCDDPASVAALDSFLPPTLLVETSPGRRQAWWLFTDPLLLESETLIATVEGVLRGIAGRLGSDASVAEVARVLRVPGSYNVKRQARGAILKSDGPRYTLDDFRALQLPDPKLSKDNGRGTSRVDTASVLDGPPEGQRDEALFKLACKLRRADVPEDAALRLVLEAASKCSPPFDPNLAAEKVARVYRQYSPATTEPPFTDVGNGERLARRHGADLRYIHNRRQWCAYDGTRWRRDDEGAVVRRGKDTVRAMYAQAANLADDGQRRALADHARRSEQAARIASMITMAQSEPGIAVQPRDLDLDPWLLNVQNGTVDLRVGTLRPHRREDMITKIAGCAFGPSAKAPTWTAFLDRIFAGNAGLIAYFQRAIGYCLTGSVKDHALFLLHGAGANGKSTAIRAIRAVMGDYAVQAAPDLLLARRGDEHPTAIADLEGARFVAAIEADDGRRLAEALVKQLTGGDAMRSRRMRQDYSEFEPTHKLWLAVNHLPTVRGTDHAIWRRIHRIPFNVTIPDAEQDRDLPDKLRGESPGILAWAVAGCLAWRRDRLSAPAEVKQATATYRAEQDVFGAFLAECYVSEQGGEVPKAAFFQAYESWCRDNGEQPVTKRLTSQRMKERGYGERRRHEGHLWTGLRPVERDA